MNREVQIGIIYRVISELIVACYVFFSFLPRLNTLNDQLEGLDAISVMGYNSGEPWRYLGEAALIAIILVSIVAVSAWFAKRNSDLINGCVTLLIFIINSAMLVSVWRAIDVPIIRAAIVVAFGAGAIGYACVMRE